MQPLYGAAISVVSGVRYTLSREFIHGALCNRHVIVEQPFCNRQGTWC